MAPLTTLEICSGVGMLGEGLRAGLEYLGIQTRTVCHLEREAYAAAVLAARGQDEALDAAPVWSDLLTFDAAAWRDAVDCIVAGFPCQDLSVAGRRAGLDGKRSGLFFDILRIADDCNAQWLWLENVKGITTATASVVDEAEGELEERAASRVLGELSERGWDAEWLIISASDVGASHGRARWFCFAWRRLAHTGRDRGSERPQKRCGHEPREQQTGRTDHYGDAGKELGNAGLQHQHLQQWPDGSEHQGAGIQLGNAQHHGQPTPEISASTTARNDDHAPRQEPSIKSARSSHTNGILVNPSGEGSQERGSTSQRQLSKEIGRGLHHRPEQPSIQLANRYSPRLEGGGVWR